MKIDSDKYPLPPRMRHHTASNLYIPISELKDKFEYYPPVFEKIDWGKIFLNSRMPDIIDVGCGKGKLLLDYSENNPGENILGIELRELAAEWLNSVIYGENIQNAAILWYSVVNGIQFIGSDSIKKIFYLFPDPWTKKKFHKRRAFNAEVLKEFYRVLLPLGKLFLATDVEEVHDYHLQLLNTFGKFNLKIILTDDEWGLPITNKENFCRLNNIPFYRIICEK